MPELGFLASHISSAVKTQVSCTCNRWLISKPFFLCRCPSLCPLAQTGEMLVLKDTALDLHD